MPVTPGPSSFTVGGAVSGLVAGTQLTLDDNGGDALTVGVNGAFTFSSPVPLDGSFAVTVGTRPAGQVCTISNGSGSRVTTNVTSVSVNCAGSPEFAYVANANNNTVSQYAIGLGGGLTALNPATVSTGNDLQSFTVDPSDRFAYVANMGDNTVSQYTIGADGALAPISPATVSTPGPVSIVTARP